MANLVVRGKVISHWTFWVYNKELKIHHPVKIEREKVANITEARKVARQHGSIQKYVTIYRKAVAEGVNSKQTTIKS